MLPTKSEVTAVNDLSRQLHERFHLNYEESLRIVILLKESLEEEMTAFETTEKFPSSEESRTKAAKLVGTNPRYVSDAKKIQQEAPDLSIYRLIQMVEFFPPSQKSTEQAAKLIGTNRQYVSDAKKIQQEAPELIDRMKSGEININRAKNLAAMPPDS